jgi:aminotransferase
MKNSKLHRSIVSEAVQRIPRSGIRDFFDIVSSMPDAISLGVGEPGYQTPWRIRDSSIYALERGATGYTSNLGLEKLREAISHYVKSFFQVSYSPECEILVTTGVSEALDLAIRAIVNPGDEVVYHEPCYVSYRPVIELARGVPVPVATTAANAFRIDPEALNRQITPRTKLLILNFPNNPTGAVLSRSDVKEIAGIVRKRDLLVIADEIYAELSYDREHTSIASLPGMRSRTILLHGLSKAWAMTGFRIGYSCAPAELTAAMMTIHQYTMLCAPILSQLAAVEALQNAGPEVQAMKQRYRLNRNFMYNSLLEMGLECTPPTGAFYAFPSIAKLQISSQEFAVQLLEEEKVAVVPGPAFGPNGEGFFRCSYATTLDQIKVAMERMGRFVSRIRSR